MYYIRIIIDIMVATPHSPDAPAAH